MKTITKEVRVSLPQNSKKISDAHPDFVGKHEIEDEEWSLAAWLNETKKHAPYVSLQLTCDDTSQKLKFAIWKGRHETPEDPHFEATQEAEGRAYQFRVWILPVGKDYRLELSIEAVPGNGDHSEVSSALAITKKRIADFIAEAGTATLPPNSGRSSMSAAKVAKLAQDADEELDNIPF
jgi:hypothetical protein